MATTPTAINRARLFAAEARVFTTIEMRTVAGEDAARAIQGLVAEGELIRHARGVLSMSGISRDDDRVVTKIETTAARPLGEASKRSSRAAEDRQAEKIAKRAARATAESMPEKVRGHFANNPVALLSELRKTVGPSASSGVQALIKAGELRRIDDGLFARAGIDPVGQEMQDYVTRHSIELAEVKRQIDSAIALDGGADSATGSVEYGVWKVEGRATQVYITVPGMPVIYGQSVGKGENRRLGWYGKKGIIGPIAAEHVARMVFNPLPATIWELIELVESGSAPRQTRRRSGSYRAPTTAYDNAVTSTRQDCYMPGDGMRLDPTKLTNPIPELVTLEMDDREDDRLMSRLANTTNLKVMRTRLAVGDFRAQHGGKTLLFERKTSADLAASMDDGRLTAQVREMSALGHACCFLIEGGMFGARPQPLARLAGIQSRLVFGMGMPVIDTLDLEYTAYAIAIAVRDFFFGTGSKFDLAPRKLKPVGPLEVARVMLETIPGISTTRAAALLERFGSIAGIANATPKEIATVDGIGKTTAANLHETLAAGGKA